MKKLLFSDCQKISFEILKKIDAFCKKENINYFIAYGTLLGAVRHQGFIPWDDDIDLIMFRDDYNRFINSFNSSNTAGRVYCLSFENETFYLPYAKVVDTSTKVYQNDFIELENSGIAVDIFPFDYVGDTEAECIKMKRKFLIGGKMLRYSLYNNYHELSTRLSYKIVLYVFSKIIGYKRIRRMIVKGIKISKTEKKYSFSYGTFLFGDKTLYHTRWFDDVEYLEFEDALFPAPKCYKEYLEEHYGDYLTLPPQEQRIQHAQEAYLRD